MGNEYSNYNSYSESSTSYTEQIGFQGLQVGGQQLLVQGAGFQGFQGAEFQGWQSEGNYDCDYNRRRIRIKIGSWLIYHQVNASNFVGNIPVSFKVKNTQRPVFQTDVLTGNNLPNGIRVIFSALAQHGSNHPAQMLLVMTRPNATNSDHRALKAIARWLKSNSNYSGWCGSHGRLRLDLVMVGANANLNLNQRTNRRFNFNIQKESFWVGGGNRRHRHHHHHHRGGNWGGWGYSSDSSTTWSTDDMF